MRFFVFPVEYVLEAHSSCKELASNLIIICHGCWNEFLSPFATRFTWSLVSSILESFLICFLLVSKVSCFCSSRLNFLRSLRFLFATFGWFGTLFPSLSFVSIMGFR